MKLNARQVETAKPKDKTYKMADGGGLYLEITAKGSKYWRMKYRRPNDKKEDRLAFGVWPTVTLAEARGKRDEAKRLLVQGVDPKAEQKEVQAETAGAYTFETIAREWHISNKRWSKDHRSRVLRYLELHIFPYIGAADIRGLKTSHLLAPIKVVDATGKHDVAQRLQQRVTAIMRFAVQNDYIDSNPAVDMAGALTITKARHYPALPPNRFPEFLARLTAYRGRQMTRIAVELSLLTFVRSSELRFALWQEFDFDKACWRIPAKRKEIEGVRFSHRGMKMKEEHIVPLSRQALSLLERLKQLSGDNERLFPGDHDPKKVMSENTVNNALRAMGYDTKTEVCGHGFRTMARGALGESGLWSDDAIERQLSHSERNNVRAAYIHTSEHLDERRMMVQWWADYLDINKHKQVTPYEFGKIHSGKE
ncbi:MULTISPECIES: tyrosine-type recombinase/integrase [Serratia]|uniref:tyrosine-type recombinase/integrase n=1 Tax=Serratia TaxID=613 RepID=UPI000B60EA05|nr:integrase arm-type DNA-binding domain-containing protein [Serratia marcescens]ASM24319.1 integrase [Serratia marcescens]ASM29097.1 integrase [Serratia marcescens]MCS3413031.1 integrase arm-type DNA-binding domain-containing protein [Serratia marcescens]BEN28613.1 integrase [Serratia marcescens]